MFYYTKKAWAINLIFGLQLSSKRFVSEFYGGIGLLNRHTKNYSREYDYMKDKLYTATDFTVGGIKQYSSLQENSGTIGNIILGIRLGLKL